MVVIRLDAETLVHHVILTRFNLRQGYAGNIVQPPEWIAERFRLLERFTAPSVRAQSQPVFDWWLRCDITTDAATVERLRAIDPRIRISLEAPNGDRAVTSVRGDAIGGGLRPRRYVDPAATVVIETRLDSDDIIHPEFVADQLAAVPAYLATGLPAWLRVEADGYQYDARTRELFKYTYSKGPFQSLLQRVVPGTEPTRLPGRHGPATLEFPGVADHTRRSWIQVVHGGNAMNRIVSHPGKVEDVAAVAREFGIDL